jgi:hypothetical protein
MIAVMEFINSITPNKLQGGVDICSLIDYAAIKSSSPSFIFFNIKKL